MTDELEARLRAHFAREGAATPVPVAPDDVLAGRTSTSSDRRRIVLVAAAVVVAAVVGGLVVAAGGSGDDQLQVVDDHPATSTTVAETTSTGGETSTTIAAGTTTTTSPATPDASSVRSVVVAAEGMLGVWDGTAWREVTASTAPDVAGRSFAILHVGLAPETEVAPSPGEGCLLAEDAPPSVGFAALRADSFVVGGLPIALSGVAEPEPRPTVGLDVGSEGYREAAVDLAREVGIDDAEPPVVQLLRSDLDGDGVDEVLITIERLSAPDTLQAQPGDYSVTALRRVVDGQVETQVVRESVATTDATSDFDFAFMTLGRVVTVADLNGDGQMEVVLAEAYYEGSGTAAYELQSGQLVQVLGVGCGA